MPADSAKIEDLARAGSVEAGSMEFEPANALAEEPEPVPQGIDQDP